MVLGRSARRALQSIGLLLVTLALIAAQGSAMSLFDAYSANQASQQAAGKAYVGKQSLDFGPFAAALTSLTAERIAELDRLL